MSSYYTVMAVTDPDAGFPRGISAFVVHKDDPGFSVGPKERKLGIKGSPTCEIYFDHCVIPGDRIIGDPGTGFKTALADAGSHASDHRRASPGDRAGRHRRRDRVYEAAAASSGKSISEFQGVQFMLADMAMRTEAARQLIYSAAAKAERGDPNLTFHSAAAKCFASDTAMSVTTDAVQLFGGLRLHPRLPGRADDARREDYADL